MERDDRIPGLTLWLEDAREGSSVEHKAQATIVLRADIDSFDLWDEVKDKLLAGIRIYTANDFKSQMVQLLQEDTKRTVSELEITRQEATSTIEGLKQSLDLAEARNNKLELELKKANGKIAAYDSELRELRELKKELDALSGS